MVTRSISAEQSYCSHQYSCLHSHYLSPIYSPDFTWQFVFKWITGLNWITSTQHLTHCLLLICNNFTKYFTVVCKWWHIFSYSTGSNNLLQWHRWIHHNLCYVNSTASRWPSERSVHHVWQLYRFLWRLQGNDMYRKVHKYSQNSLQIIKSLTSLLDNLSQGQVFARTPQSRFSNTKNWQ